MHRAKLLCLAAVVAFGMLGPARASSQYMYLDSNANGIHDSGDRVSPSGATTFDIWLDTDSNANGSGASCVTGAQQLSINSYTLLLRVVDGTVSWGTFTNHMSSFGVPLGSHADSASYFAGYGGSSYSAPGLYKLASLSFTITSGAPYVLIAPFSPTDQSWMTAFGSDCLGFEADNTMRFGAEWHDAHGLDEYNPWPANGVAIASGNLDEYYPSVVSDGAGAGIIAWQQGTASLEDIWIQKVNGSSALQWGTNGVRLCNATGSQLSPRAITDAAGGAIVVWEDSRGSSKDVYCRRVSAAGVPQWTVNGVALCTATQDQRYPAITPDGSGGAIVAWVDSRSLSTDIYAQAVDAQGFPYWTANGVAVCSATGGQGAVGVVADGGGGAILVWLDGRYGGSAIFAQRVNALGAAQWAANGVSLGVASLQAPSVVPDGSGGAVVSYADSATSAIMSLRLDSSGAPTWTSPQRLSKLGEPATLGNSVADGSGGAVVTWTRVGATTGRDVLARRILADGTVSWTMDGVLVCDAPGDQYWPTPVADGSGGVVITWEDLRNETSGSSIGDVYVQRLNSGGHQLWTPNGVPVAVAAYGQQFPLIAPDGGGGAFVAWQDYRNNFDFKIYAARVDGTGSYALTDAEMASVPAPRAHLAQNYPNPFNPRTTIEFVVPEAMPVTLRVFDAAGRHVRLLYRGWALSGRTRIHWDGKTDANTHAATGVYLYRLEFPGAVLNRKMILLR